MSSFTVLQLKQSSAGILQTMQKVRGRASLRKFSVACESTSRSSESRENAAEVHCAAERRSALGIQMISKSLHRQIFGAEPHTSQDAVEKSRRHLKSHGIDTGRNMTETLRDVDVDLPPLLGRDINEHFVEIAKQQTQPYLSLAQKLADSCLPQMPKKWRFVAGWTKYTDDEATPVLYPDEDALVLDVEVCVRDSERPVIATAVSPTHWYSWVSDRLAAHEDYDVGVQGRNTTTDNLIPLETETGHSEPRCGRWRERIVVGHNVNYDRARIKEQYLKKGPRTKFMDTMSLHVCIAGQTAAQKVIWQKHNSIEEGSYSNDSWLSVSSPNSLKDVHWLHVGSKNGTARIDKDKRDVFVKGRIQDVRKQFQSLMRYCATDVFNTHEVLSAILPIFLQRCPHPVTLAGMLEMGGAYMPVNESWEKYIADCEYTYEEMEGEMKSKLMALADNACTYIHGQRYLKSPWLCNLDWSSKKFRGKAKKVDMNRLLEELERYYEQKDNEFKAAGSLEQDGGHSEIEERTEFFISGDGPAKRAVHMPGYPEWYRNLCMRRSTEQWCPGAILVSAQTRVAPYLLRMKWKGFPLHYHGNLGWGYIVPLDMRPGAVLEWDEEDNIGVEGIKDNNMSSELHDDDYDEEEGALFGIDIDAGTEKLQENFNQLRGTDYATIMATADAQWMKGGERGGKDEEKKTKGAWKAENIVTAFGMTDDIVNLKNGQKYYFFKLPHKDGAELNVGNPLSKSFLHHMETGVLTSAAGRLGRRILTLNSMMSFWRSARQRILEQFVVWEDKSDTQEDDNSVRQGVILPRLVVAGTVTRRAVEPTWLTASNAKETRVGSELKVMIRAPDDYHFVGADVDSQELWIASVLGDMHFAGMHGSTAIGWMTLQGNKANGTDVHSKTASTIGITRDQAKILNYGRIYGAGRPFIELLLKQFNPNLTEKEVEEKARTLLEATKGRRCYKLTIDGQKILEQSGVKLSRQGLISAEDLSVKGNRWISKYTEGRVWDGGSESDLFNKLESVALSLKPTTPCLGCTISLALETKYTKNQYFPSKVNWVVQSSAVDYLHLMLVSTKWLTDMYDIDARYCISIHDEIRYLVKSEDRYRFPLALQYANLLTRAMFSHRLGLQDLPMSVAFFSSVDIDKCLRKEPTMDCKTPSNPLGLEKGHNIPQGESMDIHALMESTRGSLTKQ